MKCPTSKLIEEIGDRWVLHLLHHLTHQAQRTQALLQGLKGISSRTLAAKLKMLEADGWIARRVYPEVPPRVEYELTEKGQALIPLLTAWTQTGEILFPIAKSDCPHCLHLSSTEATSARRLARAMSASRPKTRPTRRAPAGVESVPSTHESDSADNDVILL